MEIRNVDKQTTIEIVRDTGNVFVDLDYDDTKGRQAKLRLAHNINDLIAQSALNEIGVV
jgi:hypothetical protein